MANEQLERMLRKKEPIHMDARHIARTVGAVKRELASARPYEPRSFASFCIGQAGFFGWRTWLTQAAVLLLIFVGMGIAEAEGMGALAYSAPFMIRVSAVVTMLTALPTLYRSTRHGMLEVEIAARAGYSRLLLSRLALVGVGDALMLMGIVSFAALKTEIGLVNILFCLLLPFLAMLCVMLTLLPRIPLRTLPYAMWVASASMLIISAALGTKTPSQAMYPALSMLCILAAIVCITQLATLKRQGGFADVQFS